MWKIAQRLLVSFGWTESNEWRTLALRFSTHLNARVVYSQLKQKLRCTKLVGLPSSTSNISAWCRCYWCASSSVQKLHCRPAAQPPIIKVASLCRQRVVCEPIHWAFGKHLYFLFTIAKRIAHGPTTTHRKVGVIVRRSVTVRQPKYWLQR